MPFSFSTNIHWRENEKASIGLIRWNGRISRDFVFVCSKMCLFVFQVKAKFLSTTSNPSPVIFLLNLLLFCEGLCTLRELSALVEPEAFVKNSDLGSCALNSSWEYFTLLSTGILRNIFDFNWKCRFKPLVKQTLTFMQRFRKKISNGRPKISS